jgi:uncharacterized protein (TIGR02117 family)
MKSVLKKLLKTILTVAASLAVLVGLYFGCEYCFSRIAVNADPAAGDDVTIYILTNGAHTDIVVPIRSEEADWSETVSVDDTAGKDHSVRYAAFGWGDKGFYLDIPTWDDLTFRIAFNAMFWLSTTAMHVTFHREMVEGDDCKAIRIGREEYRRLVRYISDSFRRDSRGNTIYIKTDANYGPNDAFYEAVGRYNLFFTCNTWANNALKSCGQRACLWTAFDTGIFYQYGNREPR